MKVTIITLEDTYLCESYVGAIMGVITDEDRVKILNDRAKYSKRPTYLSYEIPVNADDYSVLYFTEVEVAATIGDLTKLPNIDSDF